MRSVGVAADGRRYDPVLSLLHALRFLLAKNPVALTLVLGTAYRTISGYLLRRAGLRGGTGHTGAVAPALSTSLSGQSCAG